MTEQPTPAAPLAPEPAPPQPGFFHRAAQDVEHILHSPAGTAVSDEVKILLRGHSAALIHLAATIIEAQWPNSEPTAAKVLEVALGVAKVAGVAL